MTIDRASLIEKAAERLRAQQADASMGEHPRPPAERERPADLRPPWPGAATQRATRKSAEQAIDLGRLHLAGMITPGSESTPVAEQFRIVKRPLLLKAFPDEHEPRQKNANLIMVTSARPGEGKTFTAVNLALSIAVERDLKVLLIDADVHRPMAFEVLGVPTTRGLTEILTDPSVDLADVLIRASNIPNLTLLSPGRRDSATTELFASQRMEQVIDDIASRYADRVIIIDTPPVLASSEPSVLSLHVGQILMVVEAERTSRRAVERAIELVSSCPNINLLLNKSKSNIGGHEFGAYGYTYGYAANETGP